MVPNVDRRLPVGAEIVPGGVSFRVWAPDRREVLVVLPGARGQEEVAIPLAAEQEGYFEGVAREARAGTRYGYRLDGEDKLYPDPASRFQPEGPHGPSQVVDPAAFAWTDAGWRGLSLEDLVIYEVHTGTFTREGTWAAAARELEHLRDLGVTAVEMMPVADFDGRFGWGYDGVDLFAPTRLYGEPDDLRRFVDRAHALGLGVILDVVYNHLGPSGNYLKRFAEGYFTSKYKTDWGEALHFDGKGSGPVRDFIVANAGYWIDEFHVDGLRLDATHQIFDASEPHVLAAIGRRAREAGRAAGKGVVVIAEHEHQEARLVRPVEQGGFGLDAAWNDDFHHAALVALTGHARGYYSDFEGTAREVAAAVKWGYLYQGQRYGRTGERRGTPALDVPPAAFVTFLENHDQVAHSAFGARPSALASPGRFRAMTAVLLLGPGTPLLFQGQEVASPRPFLYFADHEPGLSRLVKEGRAAFLSQFENVAGPEVRDRLADPGDPATFERCKLAPEDRRAGAPALALHRDLLRLRREDGVLRAARRRGGFECAVIADHAFLVRFFDRPLPAGDDSGYTMSIERRPGGPGARDRVLLVNLGRDLVLGSLYEPLIAPPEGAAWEVLWSSEHPAYGGSGTPPVETEAGLRIPGEAAVLLAPGGG